MCINSTNDQTDASHLFFCSWFHAGHQDPLTHSDISVDQSGPVHTSLGSGPEQSPSSSISGSSHSAAHRGWYRNTFTLKPHDDFNSETLGRLLLSKKKQKRMTFTLKILTFQLLFCNSRKSENTERFTVKIKTFTVEIQQD